MLSSLLIAALASVGPSQSPPRGATEGPGPITFQSLLTELVDPRALSEFPAQPFQTRVASGRTPTSIDPEFGEVFEVEGRRESRLLACAGPGALVRLWCAQPAGTLRVYVDGQREAVLTAPLAELMDGKGGVPPPLAESAGGTGTLLLPIPFEESCLVTCTEAEALAYQITYRVWESGTPVTSFAPGDLERHAAVLIGVTRLLGWPRGPRESEVTHPFGHLLGSTGKDGAAVYAGLSNDASGIPSAVTELRLRVSDGDPEDGADLARLLREALLILTFDGVDTVRVPLGAFFGSAPGPAPFESHFLSVQVSEQGGLLTARFPMPFRKSLFVRVESLCPEPLDLLGYVTLAPYEWTPQTLYFHATWRGERDVLMQPARDWRVARLEGRGRMVGDALSLTSPAEAPWRAGGARIHVDAEPFPSLLGPDLAPGAPIATPLFGRTRSRGAVPDETWSWYRLRTLDAVPFFARLDFDRELAQAGDAPDARADLSATIWYYADLTGPDDAGAPNTLETTPTQGD